MNIVELLFHHTFSKTWVKKRGRMKVIDSTVLFLSIKILINQGLYNIYFILHYVYIFANIIILCPWHYANHLTLKHSYQTNYFTHLQKIIFLQFRVRYNSTIILFLLKMT